MSNQPNKNHTNNLNQSLNQQILSPNKIALNQSLPKILKNLQNPLNQQLRILQINEQNNKKHQNNCTKIKNQLISLNVNTQYFIGIINCQFVIILLYIIGVSTNGIVQKIILSIILIYLSISFALWTYYVSWHKQYIDKYWGVVWMSTCVSLLGGAIAGLSGAWCGCQLFFKCVSQNLVEFNINYYYGCIINRIFILYFIFVNRSIEYWFEFWSNLSDIFFNCNMFALYNNKFSMYKKMDNSYKTLEMVNFMFVYKFSLGISWGFAGQFSVQYLWIYVTQIISITFICILIYYLFAVIQIKCGNNQKMSIIDKIKRIWNKQQQNINMMYQMADVLLTTDRTYIRNPRKSIIGKPLAQCTNCFSQQSRFCYQNCRHVCVGHQCILQWLKRGIKKCPLCREISETMLEIRRVRDLEFQIQNKYRFGI